MVSGLNIQTMDSKFFDVTLFSCGRGAIMFSKAACLHATLGPIWLPTAAILGKDFLLMGEFLLMGLAAILGKGLLLAHAILVPAHGHSGSCHIW